MLFRVYTTFLVLILTKEDIGFNLSIVNFIIVVEESNNSFLKVKLLASFT